MNHSFYRIENLPEKELQIANEIIDFLENKNISYQKKETILNYVNEKLFQNLLGEY